MSTNYKTISITALEELKTKQVYVANMTKGHEKGQIIISVAKKNGQGTDAVIIPSTFIPVNLAEQVSKQQLIDSSDFRKAITTRRIILIDPVQAEKLLESKAAREELDKLHGEAEVFRNNVNDLDKIYEEEITDSTAGLRDMMSDVGTGTLDADNSLIEVRPVILQLISDLEDLGDESAAISTLRNLEEVTSKEYRYLYKNAPKKFKRLIEYAEEQVKVKKAAKAARKAKRAA